MKKIRILAFFLAVVTAGALYFYLTRPDDKPVDVPKTNVLVAAEDIEEYTVLTEQMLKQVSVTPDMVLSNTYSEVSELIGKTTNAKIVSGEQIVGARLVNAGGSESSALADAIKPGMRAITIGVNDTSGLKYMIRPNDKIDIIAQYEVEKPVPKPDGSMENKLIPTVKYLMQNIKVLAVDQVMKNSGTDKYTTITLEVTPQQALEITYTEYNGLMRAVLRSPLDTDTVNLNVLTITDIIG